MTAPFAIVVELMLAGVWTDISDWVFGDRNIDIDRGSAEWSPDVQPAVCRLKLNNNDRRFSPHNPTGPHYGKLGRNIPLRVTAEGNRRFLGEVSEWPPRVNGTRGYVEIEASGVLRRLSQCDSEAQSAFYRGLLRPANPLHAPAGYWPCENVDNNDVIRSAESRLGTPLVVNKSATGLGTRSGFLGSEQIIALGNSQVYADIPLYGSAGDILLLGALIRLPDSGVTNADTRLMTVNTSGTAAYWRVRVNPNGTMNVQIADPTTDGGGGGVIVTSGNSTWNIAGRAAYVALSLETSGLDVAWTLLAMPEFATVPLTLSGVVSGRTFTRATRVTFGSGFDAGDTAVGHIGAWKYTTTLPAYLQNLVNGWRGELAAARASRIAQEEGIPLVLNGPTAKSLPMIQQTVKSGLDLLTDAVAADGGVLYEPPDVPTIELGDGEDGTVGRFTAGGTLASTTDEAHTGTRSIRNTWAASVHEVDVTDTTLVVGYTYTYTVWVRVPTGMPHVKLALQGGAQSSPSTLNNTWQQLTLTWTATAPTHTLQILPNTTPTAGQLFYFDDAVIFGDRAGLCFTPLASLYNQASALTLNYAAAEIAVPLEPTDDDRYLVNEASVSVEGQGDPARYSLTTGPLSTAAPPNGAGRYTTSTTRNVLTGELAAQWARWLVHHGTWNEPRFPQISINLNRKRSLVSAAAQVMPGYVIVGTNTPDWLPRQDIRQIVSGMSEQLNARTWDLTFNCSPARPFDVAIFDDAAFRYGGDSTLAATTTAPAVGTSMTISVTSTATAGRWTTSAGAFPLSIMVAPKEGMVGELMTVTNISGTGLTQTFTVTRGANGFTLAWASGSKVFLAQRPTFALGA